MKKNKILETAAVLVLTLFLLATSASAEIKNCTNALFNANVCRAVDTNDVFFFDAPDAKMTVLIKKAARMAGWSQNVTCNAQLLNEAICTQEEVDTAVTKPFMCTNDLIARDLCRQAEHGQAMQKKDLAYRYVRRVIMSDWMRGAEAQDLREASDLALQQSLQSLTDPDVSY